MGYLASIFGRPKTFEPERKDYVSEGDVFGSIKGRTFSGIITEHPDRSSGDLIEGAPYIVDSILRDVLGRSASEVNTTAISDIGNDTDGTRKQSEWQFRRSITQKENSLELLRKLCQESGLVLFKDYQDRESLFTVGAATASIALDDSSYLSIEGIPQVRVRQSRVGGIYNQFSLRYQYSHARGSFLKEARCDETDSNLTDATRTNTDGYGATYPALCTTSQTIYRKTQKLTVDADWIGDKDTAERLIKHLMNWTAIRRWEVDGEFALTADTLALELGDPVELDIDLLPSAVISGSTFLVTKVVDGGLSRPGVVTLGFTQIPTVI